MQNYSRGDVSEAGVYFLFGHDEKGASVVYIGEAEDMLSRLKQHLNEKSWWDTVIAFKGHDLNKALTRYLEDMLTKDANECRRYKVLTKKTYKTTLKEAEIAAMAEFMDNVKLIISTMSYNVFAGASGKGFRSAGGFTVVKGSIISDSMTKSFLEGGHSNSYELRMKLIKEGVISDNVFLENYEFSSPSAASSVVLGNVDWKTREDDTPLKDT